MIPRISDHIWQRSAGEATAHKLLSIALDMLYALIATSEFVSCTFTLRLPACSLKTSF
jgi:hypothetical protein